MDKLYKSKTGSIIISIIWGLGLATLFRKVCKGDQCVIVKGPMSSEIEKKIINHKGKYYKFKPYFTECNGKEVITPEDLYNNYLDEGQEKYDYWRYNSKYDIPIYTGVYS